MTREDIIRELKNQENTVAKLSQKLGKSVAAIENDLEHIRTSMRNNSDYKLLIQPANCALCEYMFQNSKIKSPTRCPSCKKEKIQPAYFKIEKRKN